MIIKRILIFSAFAVIGLVIFIVFIWDIPAPQEKIEKNIEIDRLKINEK